MRPTIKPSHTHVQRYHAQYIHSHWGWDMCFHSIKTQMNIRPRRARPSITVFDIYSYNVIVYLNERLPSSAVHTHQQHSAQQHAFTYMRKQIVKRLYFHIQKNKIKELYMFEKWYRHDTNQRKDALFIYSDLRYMCVCVCMVYRLPFVYLTFIRTHVPTYLHIGV